MTIRTLRVVAIALLIATPLAAQQRAIDEGIELFRASDFAGAMVRFREALLDTPDTDLEATAHFWLAKAAIGANRLIEAERNLEYYLATFPGHRFATEASYQRGRLLYLQRDFEAAIGALNAFVAAHPESPFVANAVYWSGEALFSLGRLDQAKRVFEIVLRDYSTSFRVEAARYRIALIELSAREGELLQLLQWSHEEYLRTVDTFERREQAYLEAIASYQDRIQDGGSRDSRDEIVRLTTQVRTLQERLRQSDAEMVRLREQIAALEAQADE